MPGSLRSVTLPVRWLWSRSSSQSELEWWLGGGMMIAVMQVMVTDRGLLLLMLPNTYTESWRLFYFSARAFVLSYSSE